MPKINYASTKRGDTIIEVMFAIAVFCLVAVISISMMNLGLHSAENALEVVTARNEINAQAEALRFIHSSYISERTLPLLGSPEYTAGEKYQQYEKLWNKITTNAISPAEAEAGGLLDLADTVGNNDTEGGSHAVGCARVYENTPTGTLLSRNHAFVLNARNISSLDTLGNADVGISYISASTPGVFREADINARIIYKSNALGAGSTDSTTQMTDSNISYDQVKYAEGIWVVAVTDGTTNASGAATPKYYDFYIQTCWYGPNTTNPTAIDTVIRLYNPEYI